MADRSDTREARRAEITETLTRFVNGLPIDVRELRDRVELLLGDLAALEAERATLEVERDEAVKEAAEWMSQALDAAKGDAAVIIALRAERATLREALREAIELAEEGWGYADDYFVKKWDYEERIALVRAALVSEAPRG